MDFGLTLQTDPPAWRLVELFKRAEQLGFSHAWTFDSHILWQEPYVIHSQILSNTDQMTVGPLVTNPATRHPTVTASVFATLNEMFGNRTICAIGRGDSARRVLGSPPTTLKRTAEAIHTIRELACGRSVKLESGAEVSIPWVREGHLEVLMAGYGPKALATIGRHADGFVLQLADPAILSWCLGKIRAAAEDAGRDPEELTILVCAPAYVGDDLAHQRDQCRWFGGMVGNHIHDVVMRHGAGEDFPQALVDYVRDRQNYDYAHHGRSGHPDAEYVPDEIIDRFCILGSAADHVEKLRELEELGVDQFAIYLMHDGQDDTLDAYGREIIPAMQGGA
jgi:probable F420-dependent oxidoreductase